MIVPGNTQDADRNIRIKIKSASPTIIANIDRATQRIKKEYTEY
jgi:hypothetical protein